MANRCVIVGGAGIGDYAAIRAALRSTDFLIYCDCGLRHRQGLQRQPDLIVGDFDSYERPETAVETIVLPCEKDDTDTVFAAKEGLRRGFGEFLLIGVVGGRLDHTLGNVYLLQYLANRGKKAKILDDHSEMELVAAQPVSIDDSVSYFSLLSITGKARGITIKNAKYPLSDGEISSEYQYGISNQVLQGCIAEVSVAEGQLLLVKVYAER